MWIGLVVSGHIILLQGWRFWAVAVLAYLGVCAVVAGVVDVVAWLVTHRTALWRQACAIWRLVCTDILAIIAAARRAASGGDS